MDPKEVNARMSLGCGEELLLIRKEIFHVLDGRPLYHWPETGQGELEEEGDGNLAEDRPNRVQHPRHIGVNGRRNVDALEVDLDRKVPEETMPYFDE